MRAGRPWGYLAYFLFVISLALVSATSSPWVRRGRLPGRILDTNFDHGTALLDLYEPIGESGFALLDISSLNVTHPVVDSKHPYGKPLFLPAHRRSVTTELPLRDNTGFCRVVDLDDGVAYVLRGDRPPLHKPRLDPSGRRLLSSAGRRRAAVFDAGTGEAIALPSLSTDSQGVWFSDGSAVLMRTKDGGTAYVWDAKSTEATWTLELRPMNRPYTVLAKDNSKAVQWSRYSGAGVLLDLRSRKVVREVKFTIRKGTERLTSRYWVFLGLDARRIIAIGNDCQVHITDAMTGKTMGGILQVGGSGYVAVSTDGKRLATRSVREFVITDLETGGALARIDIEEDHLPGCSPIHGSFSDEFLVWGSDVYRRRFPEWWWGHFYRPEVWAAMVLGAAWLWSVARWARGRLRERRAGKYDTDD
jgi:WD40 repeat protein